MKRLLYNISFIILALASLTACQKEEELDLSQEIIGLGGDKWTQTELDKWIYTNYVQPYNIEIKYKWDQSELAYNKTLVPVKESVVIPFMTNVKNIWIDPYEKLAGPSFVKKLSPKKFVLIGSYQYNNGTVTLGEAEGGRKIVIYRLNLYNPSNKTLIQQIMKTVHHEFAHTMHQTVKYPTEYMYITPSGYTSAWINVSAEEAMAGGFITPYASNLPDEDFAEMISNICIYGKDWFDAYVEAAQAYATSTFNPATALRQKESIVVAYMKEVWGIDFYDPAPGVKGLVSLVQEAINNIQ